MLLPCLNVLAGLLESTTEPLHVPASFGHTGDVAIAKFDGRFEFGLATAPAHVEDELDDAWLAFAEQGRVAAWQNAPHARDRTRFWTDPEQDIALAAATGVRVFRMGVDWGRLVGAPAEQEGRELVEGLLLRHAWERYRAILRLVAKHKMRVMLTLFHHSLPPWLAESGGWTNRSTVAAFGAFAAALSRALAAEADLADSLHSIVPFNEPHVFALLTYCARMWPPAREAPPALEQLNCFSPWGAYGAAMASMAQAHGRAYVAARAAGLKAPVGVAHHVPAYSALTVVDRPARALTEALTTFWFHDLIAHECDFIGVNYYGREIISGAGVALLPTEEYSDAGRSVYPEGLFHVLRAFAARYPAAPLFITENGVADESDVLRPAYIIEHLLAVRAAMDTGVDVRGYVFWTVSDNWEWADGYCPKFGLATVNRTHPSMPRTPRPSYGVFSAIARSGAVTATQRASAWAAVAAAASRGEGRPFCRAADGQSSLDEPTRRPFSARDWRYGHRREDAPSARALRHLRAAAEGWRNATAQLEASWAGAAKEAAEAWGAWYDEGSTVTEAARAELLKAVQSMREGLFNRTSLELAGNLTLSSFVRAQLDEAQAAVEDWRADIRLAERLAGGGPGWRGKVRRARARFRAWWRGSERKDEL